MMIVDSPSITGTSISGPTTAAKATLERIPNTATATAIASYPEYIHGEFYNILSL